MLRLRDFSVDISHEIGTETLVLIGHSGCGKSTMLKILSGLLSPDEGKITLAGNLLYDYEQKLELPPEERNIGYVFQNYALFPHLTVRDNIAYGIARLPAEEKDKRIREMLAFLGIEALEHSKPSMLSGGEQQRVALARALVTQPKLLLLDEPLSALDVSTRSYVRTELKQLLKRLSIPTIVVTHDYEDARVLADRVAVMDRGKVIQSGTPSEVNQFPANPFIAQFSGTNLVAEEGSNPEEPSFVAFDPWKVELCRQSAGSAYEWSGKIRDMATMGGFVRLHIEGKSAFFADIAIEICEKEGYEIGEKIYATVKPQHIRPIPFSPELMKLYHTEPKEVKAEKKGKRKSWRWVYALVSVLLVSFVATAYGVNSNSLGTTPQTEMFALVAANATDPFNELIEKFEKDHPDVDVEATYAGTQIIRTQLEQGAGADLFLSADLDHIEAVKEQGLVPEFFPVSNNHLVLVVPKDNRIGIQSLRDIAEKKVKLVIGTDNVPIGRYTREVFDKAIGSYGGDFPKKAMANVVSFETNVKQVLQKVSLGEAEAGIVYVTDVTPEFLKRVELIEIPKELNVVATNYISTTSVGANSELAEEFMQLMLSQEGQQIFEKYNYDPIE